jgi:hypothetical protein
MEVELATAAVVGSSPRLGIHGFANTEPGNRVPDRQRCVGSQVQQVQALYAMYQEMQEKLVYRACDVQNGLSRKTLRNQLAGNSVPPTRFVDCVSS